MSQLNLGLAIAATTILLLGLASGYVKSRWWVSEPLIALLIGVMAGPGFFNVAAIEVPDQQRNVLLLEFARVTLAISIMGAALRLPPRWEVKNWRELAVILTLGMGLMWLSGAVLALAVLGLPVLHALLIGAVLSPTDPVLADSIVTGRTANERVPRRMRDAITAESGANDGLAMLFVLLPVFLLDAPAGEAVPDWLTHVLLGKVLLGLAFGALLGWLSARAFIWVLRQEQAEHPSILTLAIALCLAVLAMDLLLETDALLAVFAAGLAFNRASTVHEEAWHENMQDAVARFFDIPIFVLLGAMLPFQGWYDLGWRGAVFAVAVLLLRRLPAWALISPILSSVRTRRETAFNGWFGPIGIAAVFYAMELQDRVSDPDTVWNIVSLVVFSSIVLHGITATPLTRMFGPLETEEDRGSGGPAHERAEREREERTEEVQEQAREEEAGDAAEEPAKGEAAHERAEEAREEHAGEIRRAARQEEVAAGRETGRREARQKAPRRARGAHGGGRDEER